MYTKGQMEAKEAEVTYWRTMSVKNHEELLDKFAMAALPALIEQFFKVGCPLNDIGDAAYDIATDMMQARDIRRSSGTDSD